MSTDEEWKPPTKLAAIANNEGDLTPEGPSMGTRNRMNENLNVVAPPERNVNTPSSSSIPTSLGRRRRSNHLTTHALSGMNDDSAKPRGFDADLKKKKSPSLLEMFDEILKRKPLTLQRKLGERINPPGPNSKKASPPLSEWNEKSVSTVRENPKQGDSYSSTGMDPKVMFKVPEIPKRRTVSVPIFDEMEVLKVIQEVQVDKDCKGGNESSAPEQPCEK